jgi:hypothetical protein
MNTSDDTGHEFNALLTAQPSAPSGIAAAQVQLGLLGLFVRLDELPLMSRAVAGGGGVRSKP